MGSLENPFLRGGRGGRDGRVHEKTNIETWGDCLKRGEGLRQSADLGGEAWQKEGNAALYLDSNHWLLTI